MADGYVQQKTVVTSATILASDLNNETSTLQAAFDASTGHNHDTTTGGGAQIPLATAVTGTLTAANGGTGLTTITDGGIMLGSGTGAVTITAQPTNGQILMGSTGVDPVLGTITNGTYTTVTEGAGTITIDAAVTVVASTVTDSGTVTATANAISIVGGEGIDTSGSGTVVTIVGEDATTSNKGIASFTSTDFAVSSGAVSLLDEAIEDIAGAMVTGNTETGISVTYQDADGTMDYVVDTASTSAAGIAEIAIASEVNTGTDAGRTVSPDALADSYAGTKEITFADKFDTDTAVADGVAYIHIPASLNGMNIVSAHAEVITAGTTSTTDIQIHNVNLAADVFSTKLTIDTAETGSDTAATPVVINTSNDALLTNDVLRLDIDAVSTTAAKGLIVTLECRLP